MEEILILYNKIDKARLKALTEEWFEDMVKYVVDKKKEIIAIGGELHADAEEVLLESGSEQIDLWGANFYPYKEPGNRIEYTSLINIRPSNNNPGMEVMDNDTREKIKNISERLILSNDEAVS